jgi:hypothetical protein
VILFYISSYNFVVTCIIMKGKELAEQFFTRDDPNGVVWTCTCGVKRTKNGSGYSNLCSHISTEHPEAINAIETSNQKTTLLEVFWPRKIWDIHSWMEVVILGLLPFSFVQNETARKHMRAEGVCLKTLMKYIHLLDNVVRSKVSEELPNLFALVFDGWTASGNVHYLGVFATFPCVSSQFGFKKVLLTFAPMGDGDELTAEAHHQFLSDVLQSYGKEWKNVVALIGDNCSTNRAFARRACCNLIGCASHRFNLAVKDIIDPYQNLITKVNSVMKKMKNIIPSAKLRKVTHLKPKCANATRWSSTYQMLERYDKIKVFLQELNLNEVSDLLPNNREDREIEDLLTRLKNLDSVTLALQKENTSMADVRGLFDVVIEEYPESACRIGANADIVETPVFEAAGVKIQTGQEGFLNLEELKSVIRLKTTPNDVPLAVAAPESENNNVSFAEKAAKKRKEMAGRSLSFIDLRFLLPTSNLCERLFSKAGYGLSDRRRGISPANFESQLFLNANSSYWDISDISKVVNEQKKD